MRGIICAAIFFILFPHAIAQEIVSPLAGNPLKSRQTLYTKDQPKQLPAVTLPFWEDFSYPGPYPDARLWADNFVFVNSSFAIHPKTIGTATFDALDQSGNLYEAASQLNTSFVADHLTSRPIRLDSIFSPEAAALTPADSILLTFYYQPQGIGGAPGKGDSLVVEFLHTPGHYITDDQGQQQWVDDLWKNVWSTGGESLYEFSKNTFPFFKRVAIPLTDLAYFRKDFAFRFKNYVKITSTQSPPNFAGNNYIWNIDYIMLDKSRSKNLDAYHDVAFAAPAQSILRNYSAMPWSHYIVSPQNHLKDHFLVSITNLDNVNYNYSYQYSIKDEGNNNLRSYSGGTLTIEPFSRSGYQPNAGHARPVVVANPLPTTPAARRSFTIMHTLREGSMGDKFRRNDTIIYHQVFDDFFAYDDGIPEAAYGILGPSAKVAYRFVASHKDTLRGVDFFFNRTVNNQNVKPFYLTVWKSLDPQQILYQSQTLTPSFEEGLNQFTTYLLTQNVIVTDTFYVGWQQINSNDFLSIGFDLNNQATQNTFVNYRGQWEPSTQMGALMIRPKFWYSPTTSISHPPRATASMHIYPNPLTSNILNISAEGTTTELHTEIFDLQGRRIFAAPFSKTIDTGGFPNGLYLLKITNPKTRQIQSLRFIISR